MVHFVTYVPLRSARESDEVSRENGAHAGAESMSGASMLTSDTRLSMTLLMRIFPSKDILYHTILIRREKRRLNNATGSYCYQVVC